MKQAFLLAALCAMALPAAAQMSPASPFYAGGSVGVTNLDVGCEEFRDALPSSGIDCAQRRLGYKVYGGYKVNAWLAIEGAYLSYGSTRISSNSGDAKIAVNAAVLDAAFRGDMGQGLKAVGRVGLGQMRASGSAQNNATGASFSDRGSEMAVHLGLALEWAIDKRLSGFLAYDHAKSLESDQVTVRGSLYSLGAQYAF